MIIPVSSILLALSVILRGTSAFFPLGPFIFQTTSSPATTNNTAGSFTSNISFDAITNVSNVVVAVSQTMGRSLDTADSSETSSFGKHVNSSVFLFKDGNWTSFKLRKRRSTFDLAKQITNQVFAAVNSFMNQTANQTTFDLIDKLMNASNTAAAGNRSSRAVNSGAPFPADPFRGVDLFDESSQDLLNELNSLPDFNKQQRSMLKTFSRNILALRSRGWRILFDDFRAFSVVPTGSMSVMQGIFNSAMDTFSRALEESDGQCWPTEPTVTPLGSLFRSSADNMAQCYGKVFVAARSLMDGVRANLSSPLSLPTELSQQFNYCDSLSRENDVFAALAESSCMAMIPLLLETYGLNVRQSYNDVIDQGQRALILLRGNLLQCTLNELNAIRERAADWNSAYGQCMTNSAVETSTSTSTVAA